MPSSLSTFSATILIAIAGAGAARAHATFETTDVRPDATQKAVLRLPHGCDGQATHTVRITIPEGVVDVKPMPKPGWTLDVVKGAYAKTYQLSGKPVSEGVKQIVWSKGDLSDDFFDEFAFRMRPDGALAGQTIALPVVQECATAQQRWTEIATPGQDPHALKSPAPTVRVAAKTVAAATFKAGAIAVEAPWARATPAGAKVGGGYMVLRNTGSEPDRLIGFSSPVSGRGEVHDMAVVDGVMKMREMKALDIAPGARIEFKPGGMHVMFVDLKDRIVEGKPIKGRLVFEKAGAVEIEFRVAPIGGGAAASEDHSQH